MTDFEVNSIDVPDASHPEPKDHTLEVEVVNAAIDACFDGIPPELHWAKSESTVTPWVAYQLGCVAEYHGAKNDLISGKALAIYAIEAAKLTKDINRVRSNYVTFANVLFRSDRIEEALNVYEKVVASDAGDPTPETVAALMGMANCLKLVGRPHEAAVSFERGYLSVRKKLKTSERHQIAKFFADVCIQADDIGGAFFAICDFDPTEGKRILFEQCLPGMSFDEAVSTCTRLKGLEMFDEADSLRQLWMSQNTKES